MTESKSLVFRFGDVEIREREFCLVKAGEVSPIEPKAFRVLLFLLHNPQKLITKEELLDAVWADASVTESSLTRSIAKLRRALGDDIREPRYIATVATVGYRFIGKVEVSEEPSGVRENTEKPPGLSGDGRRFKAEAMARLGAGRRRRVRSMPGGRHLVPAPPAAPAPHHAIRPNHP